MRRRRVRKGRNLNINRYGGAQRKDPKPYTESVILFMRGNFRGVANLT